MKTIFLFMCTFLKHLGLSVRIARLLFFISLILLMFTIYLYLDYYKISRLFILADIGHIVVIIVFTALFWSLGFSTYGRILLEEIVEKDNKAVVAATFVSAFFVSAFIATIVWIVIGELIFIIGGHDIITLEYFRWGYYLLLFICFPFVYKRLKVKKTSRE